MIDKIINAVKLFALIFTLVQGFFYNLAFSWFMFGLPLTTWAIIFLYALAVFCVYCLYRWLSEG